MWLPVCLKSIALSPGKGKEWQILGLMEYLNTTHRDLKKHSCQAINIKGYWPNLVHSPIDILLTWSGVRVWIWPCFPTLIYYKKEEEKVQYDHTVGVLQQMCCSRCGVQGEGEREHGSPGTSGRYRFLSVHQLPSLFPYLSTHRHSAPPRTILELKEKHGMLYDP